MGVTSALRACIGGRAGRLHGQSLLVPGQTSASAALCTRGRMERRFLDKFLVRRAADGSSSKANGLDCQAATAGQAPLGVS